MDENLTSASTPGTPGTVEILFTVGYGMSVYTGPPYYFSGSARRRRVPELVARHLTTSFPKNFRVINSEPPKPLIVDSDFSVADLEPVSTEVKEGEEEEEEESVVADGEPGIPMEDFLDSSKYTMTELRNRVREVLPETEGETMPRSREDLAKIAFERQ